MYRDEGELNENCCGWTNTNCRRCRSDTWLVRWLAYKSNNPSNFKAEEAFILNNCIFFLNKTSSYIYLFLAENTKGQILQARWVKGHEYLSSTIINFIDVCLFFGWELCFTNNTTPGSPPRVCVRVVELAIGLINCSFCLTDLLPFFSDLRVRR